MTRQPPRGSHVELEIRAQQVHNTRLKGHRVWPPRLFPIETVELEEHRCGIGQPDAQRRARPRAGEPLAVTGGTGHTEVCAAPQRLAKLPGEIDRQREDAYITNVAKRRPPGNRDPRPDEIDACKGYLKRQIELIDPTVVITLGNFSTKLLLRTTTGITRMRGRAYEWWGRFLVPTFHPAAALRGGEKVTDDIRADLVIVRNIIDGNLEYIDDR